MSTTQPTTRQILNKIYKDICGFNIPKEEEREIRESKGSPVYGEINHQAVNKLLEYLKLKSHDVFYDLGSGVGKVVIHALLTSPIKKSVGIELSLARHEEALQAKQRAVELDPIIKKRCHFLHQDLLTTELSDATAIYTCSTAFSQLFMKKVLEHLSNFTQPYKLITLQDLPENKIFELIDTLKLDMSWTRNTQVHIYQRI